MTSTTSRWPACCTASDRPAARRPFPRIWSAPSAGGGRGGGASLWMAAVSASPAAGRVPAARGNNAFDGGAHFYAVYQCADGHWLAVGALESPVYATLPQRCGIAGPQF